MSGRGRGKRATTTKSTATASAPATATDAAEVVEDKPVKKTARKKQFPVVAVITPEGIEGNLLPEVKRPLIVHLPIQSRNVLENDMLMKYDPNPPSDAQPYDMNADNPFYDEVEHIPEPAMNTTAAAVMEPNTKDDTITPKPTDTTVQGASVTSVTSVASATTTQEPIVDFYGLKSTLLVQYKDSIETKIIPTSSDAACLWCCHTFTNRPVVLPIRDTGEHLIVHGNFCCPECACAHLFDIRQDSHTRWEQLALLYRVYGEACQGKIHPAPSRMVLTLFGGSLSIQEYRALIQSHKVRVDIHLPPMVSILATMDTKPIDFYDSGLTKAVSETVKERLQKAEEVLRLRRTKPLKAWESTLDACLNLKIRHDR
jgi:hypothetical protein